MKVTVFKCFIASPSDTILERKTCDLVFSKINKNIGEKYSFRIESKRWEKDASPGFGSSAQDVISDQLLDDYSFFVGIMWNKFGTPTEKAGSGTEEEFDMAYERFKKKADLDILMYFNKKQVTADDLVLDQVKKVRDFKTKISELGGLYSMYDGVDEFEEKLYTDMSKYILEKIDKKSVETPKIQTIKNGQSIALILEKRFNESLQTFSGQPLIWVDPVVSKTENISENADTNAKDKIDLQSIIDNPYSVIIKAPPQFGLTCLANYLIKEAWRNSNLWIYLDATKIKRNQVRKSIEKEVNSLECYENKIECIVLDSWCRNDFGAKKLIKNLCLEYPDTPIILLQRVDDKFAFDEVEDIKINRKFESLHLLALSKNLLRKVVKEYNSQIFIEDEEKVLNKIVSDLNVLNIHRTPLNCLTLLKVSEKYFDDSPINRTKMLDMVLFILFDLEDLPVYRTKPDVKDCEFVLGMLCEKLIKSNCYSFTRDNFIDELNGFCQEKLISLDVEAVFEILFSNRIIVHSDQEYIFRSSYWIFFFGAKRMHLDKEFANYILSDRRYTSFPEIIEFYTGIDRNRNDALEILYSDLKRNKEEVIKKIGLPENFNPFELFKWEPSLDQISSYKKELSDDVKKSNLPTAIKDQHCDSAYDQLKPYNQSIKDFLIKFSVNSLMNNIDASSRALRNSNYADVELKKSLFYEILGGWKEISRVIYILSPMLATNGVASFEGSTFVLKGDFGNSNQERQNRIIQEIPYNVIKFFKEGLFSPKISPLLYNTIENMDSTLIKHELIVLLLNCRPPGWRKIVEQYLLEEDKNSFFLYNTLRYLRAVLSFLDKDGKPYKDVSFLLKVGYARHELGMEKLNSAQLKQMKILKKK